MDFGLGMRLSQHGHTECSKISPKQEVQRMEGVCSSSSMGEVVRTTILSIRSQLNTTVIEKTLRTDLSIILPIELINKNR